MQAQHLRMHESHEAKGFCFTGRAHVQELVCRDPLFCNLVGILFPGFRCSVRGPAEGYVWRSFEWLKIRASSQTQTVCPEGQTTDPYRISNRRTEQSRLGKKESTDLPSLDLARPNLVGPTLSAGNKAPNAAKIPSGLFVTLAFMGT